MELHFCTVCGVSVPNAQVDSGAAKGEGGRTLCTEHRSPPPEARDEGSSASDPALELLFCANCRVSVPLTDFRSGRARREYGSLLCGMCTKADPGERAARRESVEAEMAADAEADDPVKAGRCVVCAAAVPHSHIVTGKALVSGDRVTCENCRAAAASSGAGTGMRIAALFVIVAALAAAIGYVVGPAVQDMFREKQTGPDPLAEISSLRRTMESRLAAIEEAAEQERGRIRNDADGRETALESELSTRIEALRNEMAGMRGELTREDGQLLQRIAAVEGGLRELSAFVRELSARANETGGGPEVVTPPPVTPPVEPPVVDPRPPVDPPVRQPDPEVVRLAGMLLDSKDAGERFTAANELGRLGDEAAIPALAFTLSGDEHVLVRRSCARSLSMLKAWNATPHLIDSLEDKEAYVAQQANFAIRNITGQDFDVTQDQSLAERRRHARTAKKWWDKNKENPPEGVSTHTADLVR